MTAKGILYVDEECRDCFEKNLDDWFGKDMWELDGNDFGEYWNMENFPQFVEVNVKDNETDEIVGKVEITSEFEIGENCGERYIETYPKSIKLLEIKDELRMIVKEKLKQIKEKKSANLSKV